MAVNSPSAPPRGGDEELAVGGRDLVHVLAVDVVDDQDAARCADSQRGCHELMRRTRIGQMHDAGAHLRVLPVVGCFGRPVLEGRGGDDDAVGALEHGFRERLGRVDPVAVQADVDLALPLLLDCEPLDERRMRLVEQPVEHVDRSRRSSARPGA